MYPAMKQLILVCSLLLAVSTCPVRAENSTAENTEQQQQTIYRNLETFANVLTLLQQHYVDRIDTEKVIIGAINGMLTSLDPHSAYMPPEDFKDLQEETKGSFTGIGIEITIRDGVLTAVSPIEDTPAYKAGIQAGDQIIRINGELTKAMTLMDAVKKLRGKKGTKVTITVHRQGWPEPRDFVLVRDVIPLHSVRTMVLEPGLLYVRITNFQANTTRDFSQALDQAEQHHPLAGLLLDLRDNPGGLLDQAIRIADLFLDKGVIVSTRGRDPEQNMRYEAHRDGREYTFPMVVLVNGGSASASEIVAGALQDHKRAIIVGTETFGKGSVQTIIPMPNGAGIRLTTARYYTPSGRSIQETGILPDVVIPFRMTAKAEQQPRHWSIREKDLPHHFTNKEAGRSGQKKEKHDKEEKQVAERLANDNQLRTAYIILKSLNIVLQEKEPTARQKDDSRAGRAGTESRART